MARAPFDQPIHSSAEQGEVMLDGPDGVAVSLTPRAARQSAEDMQKAAELAEQEAEAETPRE